MGPTLLVLAAGMGSRFGGLKQVEPVGPSGEAILDYAIFDAMRAGFQRAVFIIRRELEADFTRIVTSKYAGRIEVGLVFQELGDLPAGFGVPAGRTRPWGTGHAVWSARSAVQGPFAVVNADDFYGAASFGALAGFLREASGARFALVGHRLSRTLSESGAVSRGICRVGAGRLISITEEREIASGSVGPGLRFSGDETVSMNQWGFTPAVFGGLEAGLGRFLASSGSDPRAEFYLPAAVSGLVASGAATVDVLPSADAWFGMTHPGDRASVRQSIARLVSSGAYPARLFG